MAFVRMLITDKKSIDTPGKDANTNTLYFNVSGGVGQDPDYQALVNDLFAIWAAKPWAAGTYLDIRAYDMGDAQPRPVRARKTDQTAGNQPDGPAQIALALSYFADRNLPRQRGRIFIGPWAASGDFATSTQINAVLSLAPDLAALGGVNVDWSLWSPTTNTHTRITNAWVDNSWDVIRSRKVVGTQRVRWAGNG